ncbi:deoxyhypusine synthase, partial [Aureobasidium melanogenum]
MGAAPPAKATEAVLVPSEPVPQGSQQVKGIDWQSLPAEQRNIISNFVDQLTGQGFQSSSLGDAIRIINDMRSWQDAETGEKTTIFLGYTSNMISSGLRDTFRYLVQHRHVSAIVTTAGGVEEDFIKCLAPTYLGSFSTSGAALRAKGLNRIGNLVVPNNNYCAFEDWLIPILDKLLAEQEEEFKRTGDRFLWTPSKIIHRLGKEINDESSVYYWAYKNDIPVFCPALTDGSLGDMIYFYSFKVSPLQLGIDIAQDIRKINTIAEFDGSDAGARPDEAVSWGKIKADGDSVKVYVEATIAFPLIVAGTFAKAE